MKLAAFLKSADQNRAMCDAYGLVSFHLAQGRRRYFMSKQKTFGSSDKLAYRVNEASDASGLSRSSLYKLMASGDLESIKVAGRRLIPGNALRALLKLEAA
jgi:predicted DNA-binding transcriptional regulator AlpA